MVDEEWVPPGVDPTRPSVARVYDYMIGGKDNFAVDREVGAISLKFAPDARLSGLANRAFLGRCVRYQVEQAGIRQFIDLGSGLPTQGNVHEIAHRYAPDTRVVYIDNDPMVLAHGRALLASTGATTVIRADARQPEAILNHPEVGKLIDFSKPVGVLLSAILHHINDHEDPGGIAATFRDAVPAGSHLLVSHFHNPGQRLPEVAVAAREAEALFNNSFGTGRWRFYEEILSYFGDWDLLEPGLVPLPEWRPEPGVESPKMAPYTYHVFVGGLARKP